MYNLGPRQLPSDFHWSKLAEWLRPTALRGANHRLTAADRSDRAAETAEPPALPAALPAALVTAVPVAPVAPAPVAALPPSDEPSKTRGVVLTETWMGFLTDSMTVDFEGAAEFQQHYAQLNAEGRFECFDHSKSIEPRRTDPSMAGPT